MTTIKHIDCGALLFRNGKVLLKINLISGEAGIPKGHQEKDENVRKASEREFFEETGYKIKAGKFLGSYKYSFNKDGLENQKTVKVFLAQLIFPQREIKREEEKNYRIIWVTPEKAKKIIPHPELLFFLKKHIKEKGN
ncbi:NUDIX hydrolase [Candidatus Berkelbacteria bacterium]|nr:NUDIX hydrolase [Candidatus Berkelbacteria bacterium]